MSHEKPFERIIRERGGRDDVEQRSNDGYTPFDWSGGHPQVGFALYLANGDIHMFMNHNLDNIHLIRGDGWQLLQFTHRGKAVTLKGHKLEDIATCMMQNTLQAIYERGEGDERDDRETTVAHVQLSILPGAADRISLSEP